jgi:hypothetical protein
MTDVRRPLLAAGRWAFVGLLGAAWFYLAAILFRHYAAGTAARHQVESAWFILAGLATLVAVSRGSPPAAEQPPVARIAPLVVLVGIMASAVLFLRSFRVGPLSDDYTLLEMAPGLSGGWEYFRPLPLTVWSIVHPLAGATGLHALNIALHGLNAALVYRLAISLSSHSGSAFAIAGAALFLTFPAAVEAVTWSAGIFDVSLVTWSLLFLTSLLKETPRARVLTMASFTAALLSKETAAALPLLGWALAFRNHVDRKALGAATGIGAAYAVARLLQSDLPAMNAPLTFVIKESLARPFGTLGAPWTTGELESAAVLFGVVLPLVVATLVVAYALHAVIGVRPIVPLVWVVAAVAPLLGTFFVSGDLEGSRYLYLPLVGWALMLTELAAHQVSKHGRQLALAAVAGLASVGAYGSWRHQTAWLEAAALRDLVLSEARSAMARTSCESAVFVAVPDNLRGAFVFRNGFVQAARGAGVKVELSSSSLENAACSFEWTEAGFRQVQVRSD